MESLVRSEFIVQCFEVGFSARSLLRQRCAEVGTGWKDAVPSPKRSQIVLLLAEIHEWLKASEAQYTGNATRAASTEREAA